MENGSFLKEMGSKIKIARKKNKMSLEKLGKHCNIHMTSLWFIENGRSNVHILNLKSIADVLKMDVKEFL